MGTDGRTDGHVKGQTDMTKLVVIFQNFGNVPKNRRWTVGTYVEDVDHGNEHRRSGLTCYIQSRIFCLLDLDYLGFLILCC